MRFRRPCLALLCLPFFVACGSSGGDGGSGGGHGSGGSSGTGGMTGSGGSSGAGAGFGMGGPFAFPQNKKSGQCLLTMTAGAAGATTTAYNTWKSSFLTSTGAPAGGMRVQDPQPVNCGSGNISAATVSEGMGYGMLLAVYMNDRTTFDDLLAYVNAHLDAKGLMNWCVTSSGSTAGMGSATDADEDMAWALLMASDQWSSASYFQTAQAFIDAIYGNSLAGDGTLLPGDSWGGTTTYYPDYFSPAYFRAFAKVGSANWGSVILDRNYSLLASVTGDHGLVPNQTDTKTLSTSMPFGYDSCRAPWRIAMDYCFNGEQRAKDYLDKVGAFFASVSSNGSSVQSIGDGYSFTGAQTAGNHNFAFIGPAGVSGMDGLQTLVDGAFTCAANNCVNDTSYFGSSLRVISMLMMSGNLLDYSQLQ